MERTKGLQAVNFSGPTNQQRASQLLSFLNWKSHFEWLFPSRSSSTSNFSSVTVTCLPFLLPLLSSSSCCSTYFSGRLDNFCQTTTTFASGEVAHSSLRNLPFHHDKGRHITDTALVANALLASDLTSPPFPFFMSCTVVIFVALFI